MGVDFSINRKISPSAAHCILDDLEKWKYDQENPKKDTESTVIGSAMHCLVLEPDKFCDKFYLPETLPINPKTGNCYGRETKAYESWFNDIELSADGKQITLPDEFDIANDMADAIKNHTDISKLNEMQAEKYIKWVDSETGQPCHGFVDGFNANTLIDIKSTAQVKYNQFQSQCVKLGYFMKMAAYRDGLRINGLSTCDKTKFFVVRNTKPYTVACYDIDEVSLQKGLDLFRKAITIYQHAAKSGKWVNQIDTEIIGYPSWFLK